MLDPLFRDDPWPTLAVEKQAMKELGIPGATPGCPATLTYLTSQEIPTAFSAEVDRTIQELCLAALNANYAKTIVKMVWGDEATPREYRNETLPDLFELINAAYANGVIPTD